MSFFNYALGQRLGKDHHLVKIDALLDWQAIKDQLTGVYKNEHVAIAGVKPYSSLNMFKAILLQAWHSLSDPKLEEALRVRLDFMWFTGFGIESPAPDETTLCRFRNRLVALGLDETLFAEVNRQLQAVGVQVKEAQGAVLDATVIESAARPRSHIEGIVEDRSEDAGASDNETDEQQPGHEEKEDAEIETEAQSSVYHASADSDARWLKKGKRCYFGYKMFVSVDDEHGFIEGLDVTPANQSEVGYFETLLDKLPNKKGKRRYGDKGYSSAKNRAALKARGMKDGLMEKAARGKPLTHWQKRKNKLISEVRYIVEQSFGTLKRRFEFGRASYFTQERVQAQAYRKATCFNLLKASNRVTLIAPQSTSPPDRLVLAHS